MTQARVARSVAAFTLLGILVSISTAGQAPKEVDTKMPSFPIDADAKALVGRFDRTELVKDDVFVTALMELARSKLSPEAKADYDIC